MRNYLYILFEMSVKFEAQSFYRDKMEFEQQYVHGVYTDIAEHFDKTRTALWGSVHKFIQELPKYTRVLDCGCGNGKYLCSRNDLQWSGMDCCTSLLEVAHKKSGKDVLQANALNIPFRSNIFNAVLSIAVIHHLSNQERRLPNGSRNFTHFTSWRSRHYNGVGS